MKFKYFAGEQQTPEWFDIRLGKVTASRLEDWLSVSKAKDPKLAGKPLKARTDYEKELMFERTFGVMFEHYVTSAMQEGVDYEDFAREQYSKIREGLTAVKVGCWYNDQFVASPDGGVDDKGLLEIKWLKDTNFTEVLDTGVVPDNHWKQCQGQLFASGRQWVDYMAGNLNVKKFKVIRVTPDKEFFKQLEASLKTPLSIKPFETKGVFDFIDALPEEADKINLDQDGTSNLSRLGF